MPKSKSVSLSVLLLEWELDIEDELLAVENEEEEYFVDIEYLWN